MSIVKRAYRHLQNHPYFLFFMFSFYLVYFAITFLFVLLAKQFSDSSVQLNSIIDSLDSQQISSNSQSFKILETITSNYVSEYNYTLLIIGIVGTLSLLMIQLWLSQVRKHEYQTYLLLGERVHKLTAQLIIEQLLLINCVLLLILTSFSIFTTPIMNQVTQVEAASLQSKLDVDLSLNDSQTTISSSDLEKRNFTRFTIDPFLKGDFVNNRFSQNNTLQNFFIIVAINLYISVVIGMPNAIILSLRRNKLF